MASVIMTSARYWIWAGGHPAYGGHRGMADEWARPAGASRQAAKP